VIIDVTVSRISGSNIKAMPRQRENASAIARRSSCA
jgi:hypothetical protein